MVTVRVRVLKSHGLGGGKLACEGDILELPEGVAQERIYTGQVEAAPAPPVPETAPAADGGASDPAADASAGAASPESSTTTAAPEIPAGSGKKGKP